MEYGSKAYLLESENAYRYFSHGHVTSLGKSAHVYCTNTVQVCPYLVLYSQLLRVRNSLKNNCTRRSTECNFFYLRGTVLRTQVYDTGTVYRYSFCPPVPKTSLVRLSTEEIVFHSSVGIFLSLLHISSVAPIALCRPYHSISEVLMRNVPASLLVRLQ